ncbi:hypothetical protein LCGC14_0681490 [marine sediment metagenome]|uniref:Recombination endonuclease VII n=1 Tax=marine sediment metagenome TaxID=412755 RepID=A0A0F9QT01_9ZZZZ
MRCSIEDCNRSRQLTHLKRPDGSKYYREHSTCCKHRVDGSLYLSAMPNSTRESHWLAQGILLTVPEYEQILRIQGEKCAICGEEQSAIRHAMCVEHCHKTGVIRGLVCKRCNNMIAWVENVTSLDEINRFLQTNVFTDYKNNVVETEEGRTLRSK